MKSVRFTASSLMREKADVAINWTAVSVILDPADVYQTLMSNKPVRLDALPREHGIYALHDHTGAIRYIGITKDDKFGFWGRINSRHVGGSEGRSHKFSHAYNTGRMWRDKDDRRPDAMAAKALRRDFARRHCRATYVIVPSKLHDELSKLEQAVQAMAPLGMLSWGNDRSFVSSSEPTALVDALPWEPCYSSETRAAVERQAALYQAK
jgi:hypothetical protein